MYFERFFNLIDPDGDTLELKIPGGFGEPCVVIAVIQDGDYAGVRLNEEAVRKLLEALPKAMQIAKEKK